ncbi:uncharacterized protein LOC111791474 [Cucurbita pepo subsp. pepo]|uniref:uncharacterized protein LOC111791474 n=1 Tax=Cucurbita pepo subsp. pepo TaxID=3664 RepID=UPI000C9D3350|nr:uncharacterized protein LOC111791474 [Cucurbita pepo subsp. pepo]
MALGEEPILSRLDRLFFLLRVVEEIKGGSKSAKSSCTSSPTSGAHTSDYHTSSVDLSPRSLEKHCRPMNDAVKVTELKGSLLERLDKIEDRVLKLCLQVEGEIEREREMIMVEKSRKKPKKSFKQLLQHCMTGSGKI